MEGVRRVNIDIPPALTYTRTRMTRIGPKGGQISPKWNKSWNFSDQIQYILVSQTVLNLIRKKSMICPTLGPILNM